MPECSYFIYVQIFTWITMWSTLKFDTQCDEETSESWSFRNDVVMTRGPGHKIWGRTQQEMWYVWVVSMEVIVAIVSKLVYNLFMGLATNFHRGYNPVTKY